MKLTFISDTHSLHDRMPPLGCDDLLATIQRIKPSIHASGHIHEAYGVLEVDGTVFINACILDERYRVRNAPVEVAL
ncbi:MAG: hypothetical protein HZT40_22310 [Candidatus Thiothrix singaporensis]|uniref:Metallophosphoesterase n=1 Tax=Candidatus Thiothrix singaporensis TaxID=2799669 RepID=A0A7L6AY36_9GAMM|nr:MAG: hypothetical protein HZT40_22310 [Candidatus Thiothrix singaporensis]